MHRWCIPHFVLPARDCFRTLQAAIPVCSLTRSVSALENGGAPGTRLHLAVYFFHSSSRSLLSYFTHKVKAAQFAGKIIRSQRGARPSEKGSVIGLQCERRNFEYKQRRTAFMRHWLTTGRQVGQRRVDGFLGPGDGALPAAFQLPPDDPDLVARGTLGKSPDRAPSGSSGLNGVQQPGLRCPVLRGIGAQDVAFRPPALAPPASAQGRATPDLFSPAKRLVLNQTRAGDAARAPSQEEQRGLQS